MHLPVIPVEHVTHPDDFIQCVPYSMKLSAKMCLRRQEEAVRVWRAKDKWMSARGTLERKLCVKCPLGEQVAAGVARGAERGVRAERKGSVVLPDRTRSALRALCATHSVAFVSRETGVAWATVLRAIELGQVRRRSFRRLVKLLEACQGGA